MLFKDDEQQIFQWWVFFVVPTVGLRLPDGVGHAPESRKHEEDVELVGIGLPQQEGDDAGEVCCRR